MNTRSTFIAILALFLAMMTKAGKTFAVSTYASVTPAENTAIIEWPRIQSASNYTIEILKEDTVHNTSSFVYSYVFNGEGELLQVLNAKSTNKDNKRNLVKSAGDEVTFSYTITGLESNNVYSFSFIARNTETVLAVFSGTFQTLNAASSSGGEYTLTVESNNVEWGTVSGGGIYKNGATATITAVPAQGYQFSKWSDGSDENPRSVVVTQDSTITAIFQEIIVCEVVASGTCGANLTWELCANGTLVISGTGEMTDYTDTYQTKVNIWGATVTEKIEVYAPWYEYRTQIIKLIIEDGVTSIGYEAFEDCTAMTTVTIPSTLQDIHYDAFYNCSSLSTVYWNAKNMSSPTHYFEFPSRPFSDPLGENMSPITTLIFGEEVERIPAYLCYGHTTLKSVTLPNSVAVVEPFAFRGCTGLAEPIYNSKVFAFMPPSYKGDYNIPDGIISIAGGAFSGCSSITSITLPESVTEIGYQAFYGCTGINSPVYNATIYARCPITMEGEYTIPEGTKKIGSSAFANATQLTKINIPNSVVEIGEEAFYKCEGLSSLDLPNEIVSIGNQAFEGCKNITDFVLGDSLKTIGDRMFYECQNLQTITFKTQTPPLLSETLPKYIYNDEVTDWSSTLGNISCTVYVPCSSVAAYKEFLPQHAAQIVCTGGSGESDPNTRAIYLNTTGWWWDNDSYYVSSWKDNNVLTIVKMTKVFDYIYKADINKEHTHVIYYDATSSSLEEVKDRTETLIIPENEDLFKITLPTTGTYNDSSWGYWSVYDEEKYALYYDYGSCGENVTFTVGRDSLLTISGNGEMNDYFASDEGIAGWTPWVTWYYDSISLPEGLTKIGTYAFDWARAKNITIPSTVSTIGSGALNGSIKSIVCKSVTPPAIKEVKEYRTQEPYHFYSGSDFSIPVYVPASSVAAYKSADYWKDFTNIQAIDGSGEGGGEGGGPEPGMRAIYLVTSPSYWYNDQDYYIQSWQYESNPTIVKMDYVADYLYRAYIDDNHTTAYFFYLGKGESYTSIDNVWEGDKTKTTIPSDKDMYILTSSYMGVWSALEYGEWAKYDAAKSIQNFVYGTTGEVEYAVRRDSAFLITGSGAMEHYETSHSEENPLYYWPQWKGWSSYVTSVSLPEGLTVIGAYSLSFYNVKSVTIPSTVSVIGSGAFYAKNYTSITCKAVTPPTITARTTTEGLQHFFRDVDFSIPLYVPAASVSAYQSADYWKEFTNIQAIEGSGEPAQEERTVTLKVNNAEWGTVSGGGTFYKGDTITITATPNDGYVFVSWSNGDTNAKTQFVVGGNVVIIAQFAPLPQAEPIALDMNAVEIDYYPSYNSDKGYDYFLILYTYEDNAVKVAPLVAFDIYTSVHKDFAGEYNLAKDNVEVKYGAARIPSTSDGGYDEYDLSDAAVTITVNADNSYTVTGYITVSTGQVYTFDVTDTPYYCDAEHEKEPETPQTLDLSIISGEINMNSIDKGGIYLNFVTADSGKVVLYFGTADSTAVDIKDGTYSFTKNTKETFWAGISSNSYKVAYSYAAIGDDIYYLNSGSVTISTITIGRYITVDAKSFYGTDIKFSYVIEYPAEKKYTIFVFANDSRLGTVTGGGQYVAGTQVTLTANPANGSRFEKWSNGSTENTLTITVTSEATYVAIFKAVVSSTADETGGSNQYDVKGGVVDPWTNGAGHLPQNTDSTEDYLMLETPSAVSVQKIIRDCQLYILRNGGTYNAQGARVE